MRGRGGHRRIADIEIPGEGDEKALSEKLEAGAFWVVDDFADLVPAIFL